MKTVKKTINGTNYEIKYIAPLERTALLYEFIQIKKGAIREIESLDSKLHYGKIISGIIEQLTPGKAVDILKNIITKGTLYPKVLRKADDDAYNDYFEECYEDQFKLIYEILVFNFNGFVQDIKKKLGLTEFLSLLSSMLREALDEFTTGMKELAEQDEAQQNSSNGEPRETD